MICPKCKGLRCKYLQKRDMFMKKGSSTRGDKTTFKRTDFKAKCPQCKWEGEIY